MNTIKKYNNRKLYFEGKYINMSDIVAMIKNGHKVEVIAHSDGENVTNSVLKEALQLVDVDTETLIMLLRSN